MAWNKDIFFIAKSDADWISQNPIIPVDALIFVKIYNALNVFQGIRSKYGTGANYVDTAFMNDVELSTKLTHPKGSSSDVIFADGSTGTIDTLTISDITDSYHLITDAEWTVIEKDSIIKPTVVITPAFSLNDRVIGDTLVGKYNFNFTKTNQANIKDAVGGNINVNQGNWTNVGDFDLKNSNTIGIIGSNSNFPDITTVIFTITTTTIFDEVVDTQTFKIDFNSVVFGGTYISKNITDQSTLVGLQSKYITDVDYLEFNMTGQGVQSYFHILIPTDIASAVDIRFQELPGYNSANFVLHETFNLTIGNITKSYKHYVSDYTTAGAINVLLRNT